MFKRMQSASLEIIRKPHLFKAFAGGGGWILTIAVVVIMGRAALAKTVIELKTGVTLKTNVTFKGFMCGTATVKDADGNTYHTVSIGGQCWMKENLRYDGSPSDDGCKLVTWVDSSDEGWCGWYDDVDRGAEGLLYQWSLTQGICPSGWHVPTDVEYQTLEIYLGMCPTNVGCADDTGWRGTNEGDKLKTAADCQDCDGSEGSSGFEGLLAGYRITSGSYFSRESDAYFWSSTPGSSAWSRNLNVSFAEVLRNTFGKAFGFSVRCLKDY